MPHRPALDGVRGVAVVLVVACHLRLPGAYGGGITGVTLFFALSAFLLAGGAARQLVAGGRLDIKAFYLKRAARLVPLLVVAVVAWSLWDHWQGSTSVIANAARGLTFTANLARAEGDPLGSLGHLWSISAEAQFYVLCPLALTIARRRLEAALATTLIAAGAIAVARAALWEAELVAEPRLQFGVLPRADALLLGFAGGIALATGRWPRPHRLLVVGATVAFAAASTTDRFDDYYTWSLTTASWAAIVLVLWAHQSESRVLGHPVLRYLGQRSYGIYLWHIPLNWVVQEQYATRSFALRSLLVIGATLLVTEITHRLVERPIIDAARRFVRRARPKAAAPSGRSGAAGSRVALN